MKKPAMVLLFALIAATPAHAASVIYYDNGNPSGEGVIHANMLYNLAGHFDADVVTRDIADYAAGEMGDFDHVLYADEWGSNAVPADFLADLADGTHRAMWIGQDFEQLGEFMDGSGSFGFHGLGYNDGAGEDGILYKERVLDRTTEWSYFDVEIDGDVTVFSYITDAGDPGEDVPHFLCGGDLCFFAEIPFYFEGEDDRMLVLADVLHEFYETGVDSVKQAMFRFYALAPGTIDEEYLTELYEGLVDLDVPSTVCVIPIFMDPQGFLFDPGTEFHLDDDPALVETLHGLVDNSVSLVMYGVTHQFDDWTTGDSEFVQNGYGIPLPYDSENWVRDRIELGLGEFEDQDLFPEYWETPWHMASHGDYIVFADYFDNYLDQPFVFPLPPDAAPTFAAEYPDARSQLMPYRSPVGSSRLGILPSTLGCVIPGVDGQESADVLAEIDRLSIVRDAVMSFCAYPGIDFDDLMDLVEQVQNDGYTFVSPPDLIEDDDDADDDSDDDADDDVGDDDVGDDDMADDDASGDDDVADDDDVGDDDDDASGDDDDDAGGCGC
ncbi:MAG: DUF2334 domain-containing protein [Deltaproteobacteria bacterium]|nr:DUF2334 domain-containing protein [Deltaproteobacteria bacterium]